MPDIELPDMKGNLIKLSSLRGKTVLLYFWSPQSENSKIQNAELLQIYLKYKPLGFEIFAVGLYNDITTWANAIIFDQLSWINVIEQDVRNSQIIRLYNLNRIPVSFLISPEGEILARDLYGAELSVWLDNLLK
jgi:hypothetical protein